MSVRTKNDNVEISIILFTFNHALTVRKALNSIFDQKVDVSYEVIFVDDASVDGTQDILREYQKKYAGVVELFFSSYNTGNPNLNYYNLLSQGRVHGKYISWIEGDDYWIDDGKIMKQYNLLEYHPEYSAVVTDVLVVDDKGETVSTFCPYKRKANNIFSLKDYSRLDNPGMPVTEMRRRYGGEISEAKTIFEIDPMMGDMIDYGMLLLHGDIYQMPNKTAVYRYVKKDGGTNFNSINLQNKYMDLRYLRYWIRIENYLRKGTHGKYRLELIEEKIRSTAKEFCWKDLYHAIRETWDKRRVLHALWYKYVLDETSNYEYNSRVKNPGNWNDFMRDKRPWIIFGAGGVAVRIIDTYSWRKKVLFLTDNAPEKSWTSLKGYIIKPPEELSHFIHDAKVVIANEKYEDEIEKQLIAMGVTNYYCYCSMQAKRLKNLICKNWK